MTAPEATTFANIAVQRQEPLATITISRPRVLNALSAETLLEIGQALDDLEGDGAIRVIILTGSGTRAFSAGADISGLQAMDSATEGYAHSRRSHQILQKMQGLSKPIIAAVNGYALGGGCELVQGCDIILASENARFGQPEVNLGIIPGFGGTQRLPRLVGRTMGMELILTGRQITAQEAQAIGLVNRVVPLENLMATAQEMALTIAGKAPLAITLAKRAVNEGLEVGLRAGADLEMTYFGLAVGSADRKEGTTAFLEKREPHWQGK